MKTSYRIVLLVGVAVLSLGAFTLVANASHSWGPYHWARTVNPFTLKLGDNVSGVWDPYLATTSNDWTASSVLDTTIVAGLAGSNCSPTSGRVEVCTAAYGNNGWLGLAQIWISGSHITQGLAKMNDTYFNTAPYNTTAWKNLVMCQEVGHTFGLGHQDATFGNLNLGTCMDYTSDPDGTLADPDQLNNEHPNLHDYNMLETIYAHLEKIKLSRGQRNSNNAGVNLDNPSTWGKEISKDSRGHSSLFERDLGNGNKVFTFVTWAE